MAGSAASRLLCDKCTRGLFRFDLSTLQEKGIYEVSKANLFLNRHSNDKNQLILRRLTSNWEESSVTWNSASSSEKWITSGGDFDSSMSFLLTPGSDTTKTHIFDVTENLNMILSGDVENYGWWLHTQYYHKYYSSEYQDITLRPRLELSFETEVFHNVNSFESSVLRINRASNTIIINLKKNQKTELRIRNIRGQTYLYKPIAEATELNLNNLNLASGMYLIEIKGTDINEVAKLMISK